MVYAQIYPVAHQSHSFTVMRSLFLTLMLITVLAGCSQAPPIDSVLAGHAFVYPGRPMVLDATARTNQQAWYAGRNDYEKSVLAGYELLRYSQSDNRTYDRQHQNNGNVRDHYWSLTIDRSSIQASH